MYLQKGQVAADTLLKISAKRASSEPDQHLLSNGCRPCKHRCGLWTRTQFCAFRSPRRRCPYPGGRTVQPYVPLHPRSQPEPEPEPSPADSQADPFSRSYQVRLFTLPEQS